MNFQFQDSIEEKRDRLSRIVIKKHFKTLGKSRFFKKCPNSEFFEGSLKPKIMPFEKNVKKAKGKLEMAISLMSKCNQY